MLKTVFEYKFNNNIWKIIPDQSGKGIAMELRDLQKGQLSFAYLTLNKDFALRSVPIRGIHYWTTLAAVHYPYLALTLFQNEKDPQHKDCLVFDMERQVTIGQKSNFSVHCFEVGGPAVLGDLKSEEGMSRGSWNPVQNQFVETFEGNYQLTESAYPTSYSQESAFYASLKELVQSKISLQVIERLEYKEVEQGLILSIFTANEETGTYFSRHILILDNEGSVLKHQVLNHQLKGIVFDSFLHLEPFLIWVREDKNLEILQLS